MRISDWSSDVCSSDLDPDLETVADDVVGFDERGADSVAFGAKDAAQRGELAGSDDGNRREGVVGRNGDAKEDGHDFVSLGKPPPFHPPFLWSRLDAEIGRASCRERVCQYV